MMRERRLFFPWLQVRITGPRHLTSSLRNYVQDMTGLGATYSVFSSMVSRVRCLVWYMLRYALLSLARFVGEVGRAGASLNVWISDYSVSRLVSSIGSLWFVFSGTPCFSDEFGQASMPVFVPKNIASWWVWCSFVDYVTIFLVRLAFEQYVLAGM